MPVGWTHDSTYYEVVDRLYRTGILVRLCHPNSLLRDFDLAEEALHEAFAAAVEQWTRQYSRQSRAWLVSTGRFKAIDTIRRRTRFNTSVTELAQQSDGEIDPLNALADPELEDDRLRLIFTCCHPALVTEHTNCF